MTEEYNMKIDRQVSKMADEFAEHEYETDGYERLWLSKGYYHGYMDANKGKLEGPVSKLWHDASEPPIIDKTFLLVAPNGNSSLCLWGNKELHSVTIGGGHSVLCKGDIYSYIDDLLNLDNSCNFGKNLQEEPKSPCDECEGLDSAATCASISELGRCPLEYRKREEPKDPCKDHVSDELEKEILRIKTEYYVNDPHAIICLSGVQLEEIVRNFANWQKAQLLKNAIERKVLIDAGGYPYIDCNIELYDYDKDIPLAKKGERLK